MLKRGLFLVIILALLLGFSLISATTVFSNTPPVNVSVNGAQVVFDDQTPVIVDARTLVPVRSVFESMGFDVDWDPVARQATLSGDDYVVVLTIGNATFTTNGIEHTLDVPAQIINGRTMLPIRAVLESVGYNVYWDNAARTVIVSSLSAREILEKSADAMSTVTEYDFTFEQISVAYLYDELVTTRIFNESTIFTDPIKFRSVMTLGSAFDDYELSFTVYLYTIHKGDELIIYSRVNFMGVFDFLDLSDFDVWERETIPFSLEAIEEQLQELIPQLDLAEDFIVNAEIVGTEVIDGVNTWRIEITADVRGITDFLETMPENLDIGNASRLEIFEQLDDTMTYTVWIAQDSFYELRVHMDMTAMMAVIVGQEILSSTLTINYFNLNNATPFTLPEETRYAVDVW